MSTDRKKIEEFLQSLGFSEDSVEDKTYSVSGNGGNSVVISVEIPLGDSDLPEVLKPYAWDGEAVDRAMWKGNTTKQTWNGANFEIALNGYASKLMREDPEAIELEKTLEDMDNLPSFREYEANRKAIWERVTSQPELVELQKILDENYL